MGSASRGSLQAAIRSLAAETNLSQDTGEHLLTACRALNGQLLAVFADPAGESSKKTALVHKVFSRFDQTALRLVSQIVTARWSSRTELVDGVEQIGIRALARAAGEKSRLENELFSITRIIAQNAELELALGSKLGEPQAKLALAAQLLNGKTHPATLILVRHLVQNPRGRRIGASISRAAQVIADEHGAQVATVTSALPLAASHIRNLEKTLGGRYGKTLRVNLLVDPSIVGGLRVQIGDHVIDGTIATRLAELHLELAS